MCPSQRRSMQRDSQTNGDTGKCFRLALVPWTIEYSWFLWQLNELESRVHELENTDEADRSTCIICMERERDTVFSPCRSTALFARELLVSVWFRHAVVCGACCEQMRSFTSQHSRFECPACRCTIESAQHFRMI